MMAPATLLAPSIPSVSQAIAKMLAIPFNSIARASRYSWLRPPVPCPLTTTVVSPPDSITVLGPVPENWSESITSREWTHASSRAIPSSASPRLMTVSPRSCAWAPAAANASAGVAIIDSLERLSWTCPGEGLSDAGALSTVSTAFGSLIAYFARMATA